MAAYRYENGIWREGRNHAPWWGRDARYDGLYREIDTGSWTLEFPDGRSVEEHFEGGKRHGAWTFRDAAGNVTRQRLYRQGEHVRWRVGPPWLETGTLPAEDR